MSHKHTEIRVGNQAHRGITGTDVLFAILVLLAAVLLGLRIAVMIMTW